jgi:hypothetical protein
MAFRFYEHWTAESKAVIHREECGFCNFGRGCHDNPLGDKNGRWSESFETIEHAKQEAEDTRREVRLHRCAGDT